MKKNEERGLTLHRHLLGMGMTTILTQTSMFSSVRQASGPIHQMANFRQDFSAIVGEYFLFQLKYLSKYFVLLKLRKLDPNIIIFSESRILLCF